MASFLSKLFGSGKRTNRSENNGPIFPPESFTVIEAQLKDGRPIVGSINLGYKNYDKKDNYPWFLKMAIGLELENCHENGLPKDDEIKIANQLEDELLIEIRKIATAHYIGHLFNDSFLDVYIYLDQPQKVHEYLQTQINKPGLARGFGYEINREPDWAFVKGYLQE